MTHFPGGPAGRLLELVGPVAGPRSCGLCAAGLNSNTITTPVIASTNPTRNIGCGARACPLIKSISHENSTLIIGAPANTIGATYAISGGFCAPASRSANTTLNAPAAPNTPAINDNHIPALGHPWSAGDAWVHIHTPGTTIAITKYAIPTNKNAFIDRFGFPAPNAVCP